MDSGPAGSMSRQIAAAALRSPSAKPKLSIVSQLSYLMFSSAANTSWPSRLSPGASMAALGGRAAWFTADHALDYGYGPQSPLGKLVEASGKTMMLGNLIDLQFGQGRNWPLGSALAMVLLVIVVVALVFYLRITTRETGGRDGQS